MTMTAKATLVAVRMPLVVEKDGQRYSLDIADDSEGVDLVITRRDEERSGSEVEVGKGAAK